MSVQSSDYDDAQSIVFDLIDSSKFTLKDLLQISCKKEFESYMYEKECTKEDLIDLCWDLLRSKSKSDQLLSMVTAMNRNLDKEKALHNMCEVVCNSLDAKSASLYVVEEDRRYLRCLWKSNNYNNSNTSDKEKEKEIRVSATSGNEIPSKVFRENKAYTCSLMENNDSICPDFDGFGYCHVLGHPIVSSNDNDGYHIIGVLMVYRNRAQSDAFNEKDIQSASVLTSVAATTIANVQMFSKSEEQRLQTEKILGIIDEMSGDVREGYGSIIKKLVGKIRSLVLCEEINFWTIDLKHNQLTCQVSTSHNEKLQDIIIQRDDTHILGRVAITGQHIKIDNRKFDQRFTSHELRYSPGESILVIPVRVESELHPIAVIQAINKVPHYNSSDFMFGGVGIGSGKLANTLARKNRKNRVLAFSETDLRMLKIFATSSSVIIRNSLLFQREDGLRRKNEAMVSILKALQQKHDVTQMLTDATVSIRDALECERVTMWFEDGSGKIILIIIIIIELLENILCGFCFCRFFVLGLVCVPTKMNARWLKHLKFYVKCMP